MKQSDGTESIYQKVVDILAEDFEIKREVLVSNANLFEDLQLDSLDAVDFIVVLEKVFHFRAEEERVKKMRTIQDIVDYIATKQHEIAGGKA